MQSKRYIESSALVAAILEGDAAAQASISAPGQRVTSALTLTESSRAVLRARLAGKITLSRKGRRYSRYKGLRGVVTL
jgi:hypothetical protein